VRSLVILVLVIICIPIAFLIKSRIAICSIYPVLGPFDGIDDLTDGIDEEFINYFVLYYITY